MTALKLLCFVLVLVFTSLVLFKILSNHRKTTPSLSKLEEVKHRRLEKLYETLEKKNIHTPFEVYLRIFKKSRELELWIKGQGQNQFQLWKEYEIQGMSGELGPKEKEGDRQAPEGFYSTHLEALNSNSKYHLSFNIGYPNAYDRSLNRTGSFIMVHGSHLSIGCFAMGDYAIEEIYLLVEMALKQGQKEVPIDSYPFRLSDTNLANYSSSPWLPFWQSLKPSYDWFEKHKSPHDRIKSSASMD